MTHELFEACSRLPNASFNIIMKYIRFAQLARPALEHETSEPELPPLCLPFNIAHVLSRAISAPIDVSQQYWQVLRHTIWQLPVATASAAEEIQQFNQYALPYGTSYRHLFPPTRICEKCQRKLKEPSRYKASLFTLREGALPVYVTSLYCRPCKQTYYHNYYVHAETGMRTYYGGLPDVVEVTKHYFMDLALLEFFSVSKVFAWVSGSNCARIYSTSLASLNAHILNNKLAHSYNSQHAFCSPVQPEWPISLDLDGTYVLNGFFLYSVLLDKAERRERLVVSHNTTQRERLKEVLVERNKRMEGVGQEQYTHACDLCFVVLEDSPDGPVKLQAAVCDGDTIGCPTCAVHNCTNPLDSQKDRFCPTHAYLNSVCAVNGCNEPVISGCKTCIKSDHQALETAYFEKGKALFQLKERLRKFGSTSMTDSIPTTTIDASTEIEDFQDLQSGGVDLGGCDKKPDQGNRQLKACFGRRRTHNEQLIMRPCGIILSRATFYGAEAISSVYEFMKSTFPTPASTPEVFWFDSNCKLVGHMNCIGDAHFSKTAMPVDVFHFKSKHKTSDVNCQRYCNPAAFPELVTEDNKWRFNSLVCEQTNVWLGGYQAILRDMEITRYTFYLDEMIKRRNRYLVGKLEQDGRHPWSVPADTLFGELDI